MGRRARPARSPGGAAPRDGRARAGRGAVRPRPRGRPRGGPRRAPAIVARRVSSAAATCAAASRSRCAAAVAARWRGTRSASRRASRRVCARASRTAAMTSELRCWARRRKVARSTRFAKLVDPSTTATTSGGVLMYPERSVSASSARSRLRRWRSASAWFLAVRSSDLVAARRCSQVVASACSASRRRWSTATSRAAACSSRPSRAAADRACCSVVRPDWICCCSDPASAPREGMGLKAHSRMGSRSAAASSHARGCRARRGRITPRAESPHGGGATVAAGVGRGCRFCCGSPNCRRSCRSQPAQRLYIRRGEPDRVLVLGGGAGCACLVADRLGDHRGDVAVEDRGDDVVLAQLVLADDLRDRVRGRHLHRLGDLAGARRRARRGRSRGTRARC